MTLQEWKDRWRRHIVGGFCCGYDAARKLSPAEAADWNREQVAHVEVMLDLMYTSAQVKEQPSERATQTPARPGAVGNGPVRPVDKAAPDPGPEAGGRLASR